MTQSVFSIVAPVKPENVEALQKELDPDNRACTPIPGLRFDDLVTVHFASFVVLAPVSAARGGSADLAGTLILESCVDGSIDEYLDTLVHVGSDALLRIFARCIHFDPKSSDPVTYLRAYLRKHVRCPHLYHIGTPRMPADQIAAGAALRAALDSALDDTVSKWRSFDTPQSLIARFRRVFRVPPSPHDHWHLDPQSVAYGRYAWFSDPDTPWASRLWHWSRASAVVLGFFAVLGWVGYIVWMWAGLRGLLSQFVAVALVVGGARRWLTTRQRGAPLEPATLHRLTELEDRGVRNHMVSLVLLKPGLPRYLALRTVLFTFNLFYRTVFTDLTPGRLWGLPTIHFAQWTIVPTFDLNGDPTHQKALLFLSNYDGSWETYLDDFLAQLKYGVVAIWANTVGFPWPLDGPTFKQWARVRMSPWQYWHQHRRYDGLTVLNIHNNNSIRTGLLRPAESDDAARLWLARFGAIKDGHESFEETRQLEEGEIQGLVLSGFTQLEIAAYAFLRIDDTPAAVEAARKWLGDVLPKITSARERARGERTAETVAMNLAVTWRGLRALGLDPSVLEGFPLEFSEGIAPADLEHRSRILGDTGASTPANWQWGGSEHPVDLLLMVFARPGHLARHVRPLVKSFKRSGAGVVVALRSGHLIRKPGAPAKATFEHFGFRDGLSDPIIEGSWQARRHEMSVHLTKPGEFILGYPSEDGTVAPGIPVDARLDHCALLPPLADTSVPSVDFGRNGTYLVCRQLAQDVAAFRGFLRRAADADHRSPAAEAVGARVVGRWRDGTLVGTDPRDPAEASNEFGFANDPYGFGCPIGAHLRRANPRDSLPSDAMAGRRSTNQHRLLRRGRPYGPVLDEDRSDDDRRDRGLVFIGLNSDIERQFEFVQQNWINNSTFGRLYSETDPLVGGGGKASYLTVQANAVRQRIGGLSQFVTVKGGEYFFLPSLSSLRYLVTLGASGGALRPSVNLSLLRPPVPPPIPRQPSSLHKVAALLGGILPWLRLAWAVRVPALLIAALVGVPLAPRLWPAIATTLFLAEGKRGIFLVALLASLAAFVSMVTLRIVLLYGERLGLGHPRWRGAVRWIQVLAFQSLAVPVVLLCIQQTALDRQTAGTDVFWSVVWKLVPAGVGGLLAGVACMWGATSLQALKPGSGFELFFPPNPVSRLAGFRGLYATPPRWMTRVVSVVARTVVDAVPAGMGVGYIDYRRRRVLPGHAFALALAAIVLMLYVGCAFVLDPERSAGSDVPPVAYLLFVLIAACWVLSALTFFFDRYNVPTLAALVLWVAAVASLAQTDHYFEVKAPLEPALSAHAAMQRAERLNPDAHVIVVASEGMGLASSAWTGEVLTRLTEAIGAEFAGSVRMISASSGATLGAFHFVNEYTQSGFGPGGSAWQDPRFMAAIRTRAQTSSSSEGAWGLAYPDLVRTFAPWIVPKLTDRGWAMEKAWRRNFQGSQEPTLSAWRLDVAAGWRPALAFSVTVVESGQLGLLATYAPPAALPDVTGHKDVSLLTAARLSSAFPFVSPAARPDTDTPAAYHVVDGGYWDNSGIVSAIEWLEAAEPRRPDRVIFIEIRSSAQIVPPEPQNPSWLFGLTAPFRTLVSVRYEGQPSRNASALEQYCKLWEARHHQSLPHVVFELGDDRVPLTWNLGKAGPTLLEAAWRRTCNQQQLDHLKNLLKADK